MITSRIFSTLFFFLFITSSVQPMMNKTECVAQDTIINHLIENDEMREQLKTIINTIKETEQSLSLLWNDHYIQSILEWGPFSSDTLTPHTWLLQKILGHNQWLKGIDKNGTTLGLYDICQSTLSALACTTGLFSYAHTFATGTNLLSISSLIGSLYTLPIMMLFASSMPKKVWAEPLKRIEQYKHITHDCCQFLQQVEKLRKVIESDQVLHDLTKPFDMLDIEAWITHNVIRYKQIQENQDSELLTQAEIDGTLLNEVTATLTGLEHDLKRFNQYTCGLHPDPVQQSAHWFYRALDALKLRFFSYNTCSSFKILLDIKGLFAQHIKFVNVVDQYLARAQIDNIL